MTIRIVKNLQELDSIRVIWEKHQDHPNSDFEYFRLDCKKRSVILSPYVLVVERNGNPCVLLVGRIEQIHFHPAIGYFNFFGIPATVLTIIYQGIIGQLDEDTAEELVQQLSLILNAREFDAIVLSYLPEDSMLLKVLYAHKLLSPPKKMPSSIHWNMDILKEHGFLLKNLKSKHRSWILGRERKLNSAFPGKISWIWLNQFENLPYLCDRIEEIAMRTYQRALNSGFANDEFSRQRYALFANRGMLRVQLLEIDGKIKAFWIGVLYADTFHSTETGYDPNLKEYEIGTLIFMHMVDELGREGAQKLDFGLGDALYKQRFGNKSWRESTIELFSPTFKGWIIKNTMGMFSFLDSFARRLIQRLQLYDKIKTLWRTKKASLMHKKT
jgi:hypothetical protein